MARTGEHAPQSFTGFDRLADRAVAWLAERRRAAREREAARRAENPPPLFPRKRWDAMPPERRAELWAVHDAATEMALGSPSIMTYGAAAARLGNAGRFAAMSRRGAGDAAIRRATRYERGPFGYGVETRGDAALRPAAVFGAVREGSLGELAYIHPEVARAYPTMRGVKVEMVPSAEWADRLAAARAASAEAGGAGSTGAYAKATDTILVKGPSETEPLHMFADRADRTLVHEMQHAAQARDGLLGKTAGDYRTAAKEVDARNSANRRWLGPAERREMPRANTQDVRPEEVHMDDRGGKSPHENFRNFLATDEVPESIFGFPVVQREGDYTEADLKFFKENPKAAGFYDMGDEETEETEETGETGETEGQHANWAGGDSVDQDRQAVDFIKQSEGTPDEKAVRRGGGLVVDYGIRGFVHPRNPSGVFDAKGIALEEGKRPDETSIRDTYDFWVTNQHRPALQKLFADTWADQTQELYNLKQSVMYHARGPQTAMSDWAAEERAVKHRDFGFLRRHGYPMPETVTLKDVAVHNLLDYSSDAAGDVGAAKRVIDEALRTYPELFTGGDARVTNYVFGARAAVVLPRIRRGLEARRADTAFAATRERESRLKAEREARFAAEESEIKAGRGARFSKAVHRFPAGFYKAHGVTEDQVKELNPGFDPRKVKDGQFIRTRKGDK